MKRFVSSLGLVLISINSMYAQKVVKTISTEVCTCFKKDLKGKNHQEQEQLLQTCMGISLMKNAAAIKKETKVDVLAGDEAEITKLGEKIGAEMATSCPEFLSYAMEEVQNGAVSAEAETLDESKFSIDKAKINSIKSGPYLYKKMFMGGKSIPVEDSSSYFEFKDNATKYYDYSKNGSAQYVYSVKWKSDTKAELTVLSKKNTGEEMIKVGDKVLFEIKSTNDNAIYVEHNLERLKLLVVSEIEKK
ncbi:MAG: hypothetical protein U0V72_12330 [Cytophagales bacterium]